VISITLRKEERLTQSQRWLTALSWWCGDKRIQRRSRVELLVHIHNCAVKFLRRRAPVAFGIFFGASHKTHRMR
jgi:hypothetical protein